MAVCLAVWAGQLVGQLFDFSLISVFGLVPSFVLAGPGVYQLFTYQFLHALSPLHILFNLLLLWWLGSELERLWGTRYFLFFYLLCGVFGAVLHTSGVILYAILTGKASLMGVPVVGASGAVYGLMAAYAYKFPYREFLFFMIFPMKAWVFLGLIAFLQIFSLVGSTGASEAFVVHLGGLGAGLCLSWFESQLRAFSIFRLGSRQAGSNRTSSKKTRPNLKLVRNKDEDLPPSDGPRYWN